MENTKNVKQVICIRKDLKMRKGKLASQAAHASLKVFFDLMKYDNSQYTFSLPEGELGLEMKDWIDGIFTKITVGVNDLEQLMLIYNAAKEKGLPVSIIEDLGLTEFGGKKTITAIAIGPCASWKLDHITGHLPLL